jgi:hypothetical protein
MIQSQYQMFIEKLNFDCFSNLRPIHLYHERIVFDEKNTPSNRESSFKEVHIHLLIELEGNLLHLLHAFKASHDKFTNSIIELLQTSDNILWNIVKY